EEEEEEEDSAGVTSSTMNMLIRIPFDALQVHAEHERWQGSNVLEMLRGSAKLMREMAIDIKGRLVRLASGVDYIRLEQKGTEISDGRFVGVRVEEWPSLAASMVSRGVPSLSLYTKDGSPFNERIARDFIVALRPVHIKSLWMTVPVNLDDFLEEDEWRKCTIYAHYSFMPFKNFLIKEKPDWINNFNPRLFS
ncbi:hypothetical protein PMAYCL1PPCAC_07898, partial [Pristionchus mayeri]